MDLNLKVYLQLEIIRFQIFIKMINHLLFIQINFKIHFKNKIQIIKILVYLLLIINIK